MEKYWIISFVVALFLGIIPAKIAESKGKAFWNWYVYGVFLFFFAMIHAIVLPEKNSTISVEKPKIKEESEQTLTVASNKFEDIRYVDVNCPVEVCGYEIKINKQSDTTCCSANFLNLSHKIVSSIKFVISCYDSFGQPIGSEGKNQVQAIIQDESVKHKNYFGYNKLISLPNHPSTRRVDIVITNILFSDNSTWEKGKYELYELNIDNIDSDELYNLRSLAGNDAICYSKVADVIWTCVCGRLNRITQSECQRCGRKKEKALDYYASKEQVEELLARKQKDIEVRENLRILEENKKNEERRLREESEKESLRRKREKLIYKLRIASFILTPMLLFGIAVGTITNFSFSYKGYELRKMGIDIRYINSVLNDGSTYFSKAVADENTEKIDILIKYGADINVKDSEGNTPLLISVGYNTYEISKLLIDKGANTEVTNNQLNTPLHLAVKSGNLELIKLLIEKGANINSTNQNKDTPLLVAAKLKRTDLVNVLLENGADSNITDVNGDSCLDIAVKAKDKDLFRFLTANIENMTVKITMQSQEITGKADTNARAFDDFIVKIKNKEIFDFYMIDGEKALFDEDGFKRYEGEVKNGKIDGYGIAYNGNGKGKYEDNQILYCGYWKNNKWEGKGKSYWLKYSKQYINSNDEPDEHYKSQINTVFYDTTYKNGFRSGEYRRYYPNGELNDRGIAVEGKNNSDKYGAD